MKSALIYLAALVISCVFGFIITALSYSERELLPEEANADDAEEPSVAEEAPAAEESPSASAAPVFERYRKIRHGETIVLGMPASSAAAHGGKVSDKVARGEAVSGEMPASFTYVITNPSGLHVRPSGKLADLVNGYDCNVTVSAKGKSVPANSPIQLLSLGASVGTELSVEAEGTDAQAAILAVKTFMEQAL